MSNVLSLIERGFYLEWCPVILVGILAGVANFCRKDSDVEEEATWKDFFYHFSSSILVCSIIYAILDSTGLTYMTRWAIAGAVSFYGIDKALDITQRLLNLRNSKTEERSKSDDEANR